MRFQNKAKPIKFCLPMGDKECRSVEDVKNNFAFDSLYDSFKNGTLQKWLKQIGESELFQASEKITGADILSNKIHLYNLFAPEKLLSDNVDGSNVIALLEKDCIKFEEIKNTAFIDDLFNAIDNNYVNYETINHWCENDLDLLKYVYSKKSFDNLNAKNCMRLIDEKVVVVASDEIFAMWQKQKIDDALLNHLCENDLNLLKYVYSKMSYGNLNAQNCRTLINQKIVTNDDLAMEIATRKNLNDILVQLGKLIVMVDDVAIEMILVKGYRDGDFYIGKYPVTQAQWQAVMGNNPSKFKGEDNPVEQISWNDCNLFISKLNRMCGHKFRLPKETEWEYAARGGSKTHNYTYSGSNCLDEVGWSKSTSGNSTHPVGKKKPNELGIYDMSGNVLEWCEDLHLLSFLGSERVSRGGSWSFGDSHCAISYRNNNSNLKYCNYGFRLAMDA